MKSLLLTTTLVMAVSGFATSVRADTKNSDEFIQKASIAGKFEIESSKLALEKSSNPDVKAFAQKMIDDHTKADKELKATIKTAKLDITAPAALDEKHQKELDKLKEAKPEDFDKDYLKIQEDAHDEAVDLFEDYSEKGDNASLKEFATKTLPTLKEHHEKVDALEEKHEEHAKK